MGFTLCFNTRFYTLVSDIQIASWGGINKSLQKIQSWKNGRGDIKLKTINISLSEKNATISPKYVLSKVFPKKKIKNTDMIPQYFISWNQLTQGVRSIKYPQASYKVWIYILLNWDIWFTDRIQVKLSIFPHRRLQSEKLDELLKWM